MERHVVFDFFSDSKETAITKLSDYLHIPESKIGQALKYDCSPESFINELRIDSIFTKGKAALGLFFLKREAIIIQLAKHIRNTQATCHRYWHAKVTH